MKKTIALILTMALTFVLCACGSTSAPAASSEPASSTNVVITAEPAATAAPAEEILYPAPDPVPAKEGTPTATAVSVSVGNEGTVESQHMDFTVTFDSDIEILDAEQVSAVHIGNQVDPARVTTEVSGNTAVIHIKIDALKMGKVNISYIGENAQHFAIKGTVSPGTELTVTNQDSDKGTATFQVTHLWDVRGIAQLQLWENGELILTQGDEPAEITGIHGHDFLQLTPEGVAEKMAGMLKESFPEGYTFSSEGDTFTVETSDGRSAELNVTVFSGITIAAMD